MGPAGSDAAATATASARSASTFAAALGFGAAAFRDDAPFSQKREVLACLRREPLFSCEGGLVRHLLLRRDEYLDDLRPSSADEIAPRHRVHVRKRVAPAGRRGLGPELACAGIG